MSQEQVLGLLALGGAAFAVYMLDATGVSDVDHQRKISANTSQSVNVNDYEALRHALKKPRRYDFKDDFKDMQLDYANLKAELSQRDLPRTQSQAHTLSISRKYVTPNIYTHY